MHDPLTSNEPHDVPSISGDDADAVLRDAAARLYEEASASQDANVEAARRPVAPFNVAIWIGVSLICLEVLSLGFIYGARCNEVTALRPEPNPLLHQDDCRGEVYRTYRKIYAYKRDHGRLPASLTDLQGKYSVMVPTDPRTGEPLRYSAEGATLVLQCPEGGAPRIRSPGGSV